MARLSITRARLRERALHGEYVAYHYVDRDGIAGDDLFFLVSEIDRAVKAVPRGQIRVTNSEYLDGSWISITAALEEVRSVSRLSRPTLTRWIADNEVDSRPHSDTSSRRDVLRGSVWKRVKRRDLQITAMRSSHHRP